MPKALFRIPRQLRTLLFPWRWVLAYTGLLLLSLPYVRGWMDRLEEAHLSGLLSVGLGLLWAGFAIFLIHRLGRTRAGRGPASLFRFTLFLAVYSYCILASTSFTVERVHFVEYGLLGYLCFRAASVRQSGWRQVAYGLVAVFAIGFLDEVIQGLLPSRYYDLRDIRINLLAGSLPLLGLLFLSLIRLKPPGRQTRKGFSASDGLALSILLLLVAAIGWIGHVNWDLRTLWGTWARQNRCGRHERIEVRPDGAILWRDDQGNRAHGRYRVAGNRLDGPLLRVEVKEGSGVGPCAWKAGTRMDHYYRAGAKRLVFTRDPGHPFHRVLDAVQPLPDAPLPAVAGPTAGAGETGP